MVIESQIQATDIRGLALTQWTKWQLNFMIPVQKIKKVKRKGNSSAFYFILTIIGLQLMACTNDIATKQKQISGSNYKLWQEIKNPSRTGPSIFYWYFDNLGKCTLFVKYRNRTKIEKFNTGDVILIEKWKFVNKDKINIGGEIFNVDSLNDTHLLLRDTAGHQEIKLVYKGDKIP